MWKRVFKDFTCDNTNKLLNIQNFATCKRALLSRFTTGVFYITYTLFPGNTAHYSSIFAQICISSPYVPSDKYKCSPKGTCILGWEFLVDR